VSLEDAITTAENTLGGKFNEHPPTLEYVALKDGSVALAHVVQVQNDATGAWYEAFVDAHANKVQTVTDFVAKASCRSPLFPCKPHPDCF
jgi:extracellular elastinolytic metalloproteinase